MSIFIPEHVKVIVEGTDGNVRHAQSLSDYLRAPSLELQLAAHGASLLEVLVQESYITHDLMLNKVLTGNPHADATRLIGSIAESLVVNLCNTYPDVNRILSTYARFGQRTHKKLDDYVAVATGSQQTKREYNQHYNPCDTQRDIIWVERDNTSHQLLCINASSATGAKPAGLQVKASHDGIKYVLPTILDYHYPVLYFDLSGDWGAVKSAVSSIYQDATIIHPGEIQHEIKHILCGYFDIVVAIIQGELSIERLIFNARENGDSVLLTGLDGAEPVNATRLILPSRIK